jgi:hypothetical protein
LDAQAQKVETAGQSCGFGRCACVETRNKAKGRLFALI